jgi:ADP-ribosyl-[dinitrogen reductase] hydrolase
MTAPRPELTAPIADSYVVPQTKLIAGEYPGSLRDDHAHEKLAALLAAGVTTFVDLTDDGELHPYLPLLRELEAHRRGARPVVHRRLPITDMEVPTVQRMREVLDLIDEATVRGGRVYVHCWGGVGRTGTVVGCHLVRHGLSPDEALAEVGRLFATMSRAKRHRHPEGSPQTQAQRAFVKGWTERSARRAGRPAPQISYSDRFAGALLGLAVGDALGTTLEFRAPGTFRPISAMVGGGPFNLAPGQWTDDTSMAMCLAESLLRCKGFDAADQMRNYVRWVDEGFWSSTGNHFDVGNVVSRAITTFRQTGQGFAGPTEEHTAGNGSLMRLAPVPMYYEDDGARAIRMAANSSRVTHGTAMAVDACRYFAGLLVGALRGESKATLLGPHYTPVPGLWAADPLHSAIAAVAAGSFHTKQPPAIRGTGFVVQSLEAALWAFATTESFAEGALEAVNLGDDADTTGAIFGQLAGAHYGVDRIPSNWLGLIARGDEIRQFARDLARGDHLLETSRRQGERAAVRKCVAEARGDLRVARRRIEEMARDMGYGGSMHAQAGAEYALALIRRWEYDGGEVRESRPGLDTPG